MSAEGKIARLFEAADDKLIVRETSVLECSARRRKQRGALSMFVTPVLRVPLPLILGTAPRMDGQSEQSEPHAAAPDGS